MGTRINLNEYNNLEEAFAHSQF